jgi:hypothetical protein
MAGDALFLFTSQKLFTGRNAGESDLRLLFAPD